MAEKLPLSQRKIEALRLRKSGYAPARIARELGFRDAATVDRFVAELLAKDAPADSSLSWHELELARLDDLQVALTDRMEAGEKGAERDLMKLLDYRIRLQSARNRKPGRMHEAITKALGGLDLLDADEGAKQSALDMATMIDVAMSVGTADDQRRAINAMATMRNLLNDLGASPAARDELDAIARVRGGGKPEGQAEIDGGDPEKGAEVLSFMAAAQARLRAAK